jgi:fermentation-respiration switch protein FrsA (DUF1100 family)
MLNFKKGFCFIISLLVLIIIGIYFMQEKLIFLPTKLTSGYKYQFSEPFEELFLESEDGARLNAVHFKIENPKGLILYFHGNAGDLSRWGEIASELITYHYDVLIMDYRSYGKSTGDISEQNLFDDANLFYKYALKSYSEDDIVVYGRSLGTAFAVFIASENNPRKLILETPFYSLEEIAKKRFPFLPVNYLLKYRFLSNDFIEAVRCPVVIFHGTKDNIVPFASGKNLSALVPEDRLTFVPIEGGAHNNLINFKEYKRGIDAALK